MSKATKSINVKLVQKGDIVFYQNKYFAFERAKQVKAIAELLDSNMNPTGARYDLRIPFTGAFEVVQGSKSKVSQPKKAKTPKGFVSLDKVGKGKLFMLDKGGRAIIFRMSEKRRTRYEVTNPMNNKVFTMSGSAQVMLVK